METKLGRDTAFEADSGQFGNRVVGGSDENLVNVITAAYKDSRGRRWQKKDWRGQVEYKGGNCESLLLIFCSLVV